MHENDTTVFLKLSLNTIFKKSSSYVFGYTKMSSFHILRRFFGNHRKKKKL